VISQQRDHGRLTVGHIEAKDVGVPLGPVETSDQGKRYLNALDNLVFTDYLEFRWYVDGKLRDGPHRFAAHGPNGQLVYDERGIAETTALLHDFTSRAPVSIGSPRELAERMARLTHLIRDIIVETFRQEQTSTTLMDLRRAFSQVLLPDLSVADFADMFAQTLAYGLFAARINHEGSDSFRREDAAFEIPKTNPFLRRLFSAINGPDLNDEPFIGFADDLA